MSTTHAAAGPPGLRLSVAMTTYNGARHLAEQLESLAAQTRPPDELVVCDERSADATAAILEAFGGRAPFPVRVVRNESRLGIVRNFEQAVRLCTGDVIFLADQDDVWYPEKLAEHEAVYRARPDVGLVFNNLDVVDEQLRPRGYTTFEFYRVRPERQAMLARGDGFPLLARKPQVTGCAASFRAEFRDYICPMPERLWLHDEWIALVASAVSICLPIPRPLAAYRQHGQQSVGANFDDAQRHYDRAGVIDDQLDRLDMALERLQSIEPRLRRRSDLDYIRGRQAHLRRRRGMRPSILGRLPTVARELLNGNYKRYGLDAKSELKSDLERHLQATRVYPELRFGRAD